MHNAVCSASNATAIARYQNLSFGFLMLVAVHLGCQIVSYGDEEKIDQSTFGEKLFECEKHGWN
jgi:hypothetical protein